MNDHRKAISGDILKATVEKSQTNVASVTMNHLRKAIWGDIWKRTVEKSQNKFNQCDYASADASNLKQHLKTHSREKSNKSG